MIIPVIKIGISKGIRLPKTILDKYNITAAVELILEKDYLIIKPNSNSRAGWEKSFKKMHSNGDDKLLLSYIFEDENLEERTKSNARSY